MKDAFKKCVAIFLLCSAIPTLSGCDLAENQANEVEKVSATVIEIEKYGHAVLDISVAEFVDCGYEFGDVVCVSFGSYESDMPFYDGYYSAPGAAMLRGVSDQDGIAICINYGDFSKETGLEIGDRVEIGMVEKARMREHYELSALRYSDNREDYSSDAEYANFRAVTAGSIGEGKLYRSASPINNERGRAACVNALIAEAGVATVVNLADSSENIEAFFEADGADSVYYRQLYETGKVIALDLNGNFFSDEFITALIDGLLFIAQNEPPYNVHCLEGKDRSGFAVMLLEALMGAELQEIVDDYMLSFYNYYGVTKEKEPERYEIILNTNLFAMLCHVTGAENAQALAQVDLEEAVTNYLLKNGMNESDIIALKNKLS